MHLCYITTYMHTCMTVSSGLHLMLYMNVMCSCNVIKCSQCPVPCFLFRPNRPLPNPVYDEYEYIDSKLGGVALENMTKNPAYVTKKEAVTSFSSGMEAGKGEEDHTYEELPFEAIEEEQRDTAHGIL